MSSTFNQNTTINGNMLGSTAILDQQSDKTEWYQMNHCICPGDPAPAPSDCRGTGLAYLHVRTPIPADASAGMGWNPYMLEVVGYHTYSGEKFHDFKAVVNTTGDGNNTFYGSYIRVNRGNAGSSPYVYRSANTYGGVRRMCFAVGKVSCCCTGNLWIKIWTNAGYRADYAWGSWHSNSNTAYW